MKTLKTYILLFVVGFMFVPEHVCAQTITIGSGNATNGVTTASPVNIYFRRQISQMVYTVAELNAAGINGASTINEIGFFVSNKAIFDIPGYTISLKHTNATNAAGNLNGGYSTVVNSHTYSGVTGDWNMMTCDNPFAWNGTQNIAVQVCWSQVAPTWDPSGQVRVFNSTSGYRYRRDDNFGSACGNTPNQVLNTKPHIRFVFETETVWTGAISTDWFNPANWSADVPNVDMDARIPVGTPNNPSLNGLAECLNFTVEGTFNLTGSGALDVYGDLVQNGTITDNGGTITFRGTGSNTLTNNSSLDLTTLNCESKGGVTFVGNPINIARSLGVQKSTLQTNNLVTIQSNSGGTARIDELITNCFYTLTMTDTWGDGWNGGFLEVFEDGVSIGTYAATDANDVETLSLGNGSTINFVYTAGSFENENAYVITDPGGGVVFADGTNPSTGTVFTTVPACSFTDPITGNVTVERYIDAGETFWRYFGSSVAGANLGQLNDDFATSGYPGSWYPNFGWTSVYSYNETAAPGNGYVPATGVGDVMSPGQGWQIWSGDTSTGTQPFTIDLTGVPNQGDINMPVTYTPSGTPTEDGFNLVANPYASTIDWDDSDWTKTNMANATYIQNPDNQQYATYVAGASTNGGSRYIASGQSFWVQAFAVAPVLTAREGVKSSNDQAFLKTASVASPGMKITLQGNAEFDEAVLRTIDGSLDDFEPEWDAEKWFGGWGQYPQVSLINNQVKDLTVHSFDNGNQEFSIPVRAIVFQNGIYNMVFNNISEIDVPCMQLEDTYTGQMYLIEEGVPLPFEMSDTTYAPRFIIHMGKKYDTQVSNLTCNNELDGEISLDLDQNNDVDYVLTSGSTVINGTANGDPLVLDYLASGIYIVEIPSLVNACNQTAFNFVVNEPSPIVNSVQVSDEMNGSDGAIVLSTTGGTAPYQYIWMNGSNNPSQTNLKGGTYEVTVIDMNGCEINDTYVVNSQLGIEDNNLEGEFVYLPEMNQIKLNGFDFNEGVQLNLFSVDGKTIKEYSIQNNTGNHILDLPADIASGVYFLGNNDVSFKFNK